MKISLDDFASNLFFQIDPKFSDAIFDSFNYTHPSSKFSQIKLDKPSFIFAIGKNAIIQAKAVIDSNSENVVGARIHQVKGYTEETIEGYETSTGYLSHPFPDEETFKFTEESIGILQELDSSIDIHFLISGGGSAAYALPEEGIENRKYLEIIRLAIASGFDIYELNLIRTILDRVKGGKTIRYIPNHTIYAWVSSDVVDDDERIIASGPVSPGIDVDPSIINWLERSFISFQIGADLDELVANLPNKEEASNVTSNLFLTRNVLIQELQKRIEEIGFDVFIADTSLDGTVIDVSQQIKQLMKQFSPFSKRVVLWSGEPTISLNSQALDDGQGGRISAISVLISKAITEENLYFIGLASDGQDGSSPSSGYILDHQTYDRIKEMGSPNNIVTSGNSGIALTSTGHGIYLENTDINLLDIFMVVIK